MGKKNHRRKRKPHNKQPKSNFVSEAGPGCYIARRELSPEWILEWEDVDPTEFEGEEVPDVAVDTEAQTLSVCNIEPYTQIAFITVFETRIIDSKGQELKQGITTDNKGVTMPCVTFIVLCPPHVFAHLCFVDVPKGQDITKVRIESDIREWKKHPNPSDEHPQKIGFPLEGGPFLCTQGENGELTHFFSGNLHAIDFACPVGTPLLAVANGTVVEAKDCNSLTGISVSNLFEWNSILIRVDEERNETQNRRDSWGALFVEYVHIQKSLVKAGERIVQGQVIGLSGSVGFSPEPHLHFSAFRSSDPEAPTVRVKFQKSNSTNTDFFPSAGKWYNANGLVHSPPPRI